MHSAWVRRTRRPSPLSAESVPLIGMYCAVQLAGELVAILGGDGAAYVLRMLQEMGADAAVQCP